MVLSMLESPWTKDKANQDCDSHPLQTNLSREFCDIQIQCIKSCALSMCTQVDVREGGTEGVEYLVNAIKPLLLRST